MAAASPQDSRWDYRPHRASAHAKGAKRIWANRQSAARSKERKMRYISELERKVQTLHAEATTLSTQLALLHRDTAGLSTKNSELKMRLQNVQQQIHLQDALNDALKSELQRLKMATSHMGNTVGGMMNLIGPPPPHSVGGNQPMFHIQGQAAMQPLHQMQQIHPQHQQPLLHPLQLQAQQLLLQQQASAAPPPNPKMKRAISAPNQWIGGWSESSGN
uniref:Transcription factor RF2a n=1 Tax=Aegilops tauschii TaxID=37682 RepID=M8BYD1_AEGTA